MRKGSARKEHRPATPRTYVATLAPPRNPAPSPDNSMPDALPTIRTAHKPYPTSKPKPFAGLEDCGHPALVGQEGLDLAARLGTAKQHRKLRRSRGPQRNAVLDPSGTTPNRPPAARQTVHQYHAPTPPAVAYWSSRVLPDTSDSAHTAIHEKAARPNRAAPPASTRYKRMVSPPAMPLATPRAGSSGGLEVENSAALFCACIPVRTWPSSLPHASRGCSLLPAPRVAFDPTPVH